MPLSFDAFDLSPAEVRERFSWAKRQGRAAWLWPDISIEAWQEALRDIEDVLRDALAGQAARTLNGDPAAVGLACYTAGVGPLLGYWLEQGRVSASPDVVAVLELHLQHNRLRSARMEAAAVSIVEALAKRNIAVAVLKGAHSGPIYFEAPGVRPASDIDLLVHGRDMVRAEEAIIAQGFTLGSRTRWESSWHPAGVSAQPRSLSMVHAEDPWSVDLHGSLNINAGAGAPVARLDDADPMSSRTRWPPHPASITLDQPLLLLHLAVHAGAGLHNLSLLRLTELALVIQRDGAARGLSWDAFLATGERTDSLGYAFPALSLCGRLVGSIVPEQVIDRCAERAPAAVRRLVDRLTPATAQRIDRSSLAEHFMWCGSWGGRLRQIASDMFPSTSWRAFRSIYERRAWAMLRGRIEL